MPMNWTPEADRKLLAAILTTMTEKINYAAVAALMGPDCTQQAVRHQVSKHKETMNQDGSTPSKSKKRKNAGGDGVESVKKTKKGGGGDDAGAAGATATA